LVYVGVAVPLSAILGTQGLALATSATGVVMFCTLYVCLSRALPDFKPLLTAMHLVSYLALGLAAIAGTIGMLEAFDLPPAIITTASLPIGTALYCATLLLFRDATFQRLREYARGMVVRRAAA
jgi:peptidoglycan biosynthesis protein MviN/MurJ (putative lipid II flippase)